MERRHRAGMPGIIGRAELRKDAFPLCPSGEEGPTRRSSKCHATFESARRGRSYTGSNRGCM